MSDARDAITARAVVASVAGASVDGFSPDLRVREAGLTPGWLPLRELADPAGGAERHRLIAAAAGPGAPARLPRAWEVEAVAWHVGALVAGGLIGRASLLAPEPGATRVRVGSSGLAEGVAISAATRCIEPTPANARAVLCRLVATVLGEDAASRTSRVLWWHAGDRIADAALWCGEAFDAREHARRLAEALLAPGMPFSVPVAVVGAGPQRRRRTCCLSRRIVGGETCADCPHHGPPPRSLSQSSLGLSCASAARSQAESW